MFGDKANKRGDGIHKPPWNPTAFSLLKREIRKSVLIGIKAPETKAGVLPFIYMKGQTVGNVPEKP